MVTHHNQKLAAVGHPFGDGHKLLWFEQTPVRIVENQYIQGNEARPVPGHHARHFVADVNLSTFVAGLADGLLRQPE